MAVTKRTRFEVLRRDKFRCFYCGTRGNETGEGLTVDHVTPKALGGTDDLDSFATDWYRRGIPLIVVRKAMKIAWDGPAAVSQKLKYTGGVIRKLMADAEDRTRALLAGDEVVYQKGYEDGWHDGQIFAETQREVGVELKGVNDAS